MERTCRPKIVGFLLMPRGIISLLLCISFSAVALSTIAFADQLPSPIPDYLTPDEVNTIQVFQHLASSRSPFGTSILPFSICEIYESDRPTSNPACRMDKPWVRRICQSTRDSFIILMFSVRGLRIVHPFRYTSTTRVTMNWFTRAIDPKNVLQGLLVVRRAYAVV